MMHWFRNTRLYKTVISYYEGKNISVRIFFVLFSLAILLFLLWGTQTIQTQISHTQTLSFAGQQVPMDGAYSMNQERYDRELALTALDPAQIVMIHKRWNLYMPMIEDALDDADLPEDLQYIPVIESALRNVAVSSAGAAGIWQFMPDTARRYGLVVDDFVDERLDPVKATQAAVRYLRDLYTDFNEDVFLTAAAYNRGENGLQRDLSRQGVSSFWDAQLNSETSRYIFRLIAMKQVWENRHTYVDSSILGVGYNTPDTKTVRVGQIDNLATWARDSGYTYAQIKYLNPWIV